MWIHHVVILLFLASTGHGKARKRDEASVPVEGKEDPVAAVLTTGGTTNTPPTLLPIETSTKGEFSRKGASSEELKKRRRKKVKEISKESVEEESLEDDEPTNKVPVKNKSKPNPRKMPIIMENETSENDLKDSEEEEPDKKPVGRKLRKKKRMYAPSGQSPQKSPCQNGNCQPCSVEGQGCFSCLSLQCINMYMNYLSTYYPEYFQLLMNNAQFQVVPYQQMNNYQNF